MRTILEVLLINVKSGKSKKPPYNDYAIPEAHCVLRDEMGKAGAVGVLNLPKGFETVTPGLYTASFAMEAPTYGENQGKVIAVLKGLVPVPPGAFKGNASPSAQGVKA